MNPKDQNKLRLETLAIHSGYTSESEHSSVIQSMVLSTTFERNSDGTHGTYNYSRLANPNRTALETKLAALEEGAHAITFSSGLAAILSVFQSVLSPGAHIIIPDDCYHGTRALLENTFNQWGVTFTETDMSDVNNIANCLTPVTKLIWIETPSNPKVKITDIAAVVTLARSARILCGCDNTFATPFLQNPLAMGADVVMHSTTKFLGGHSDLLGGVIVLPEHSDLNERIRNFQQIGGAVPSPFDCWLLYRSLATFPLRMQAHCANALKIATYLSNHKAIEKVYYPGLKTDPGHDLASRQMCGGFGGVLSVEVAGGKQKAMELASKLKLFRHATSLGGVESLIEHRRSAEGQHPRSPENLLRISVGLEHVDDLIADLEKALS